MTGAHKYVCAPNKTSMTIEFDYTGRHHTPVAVDQPEPSSGFGHAPIGLRVGSERMHVCVLIFITTF